MKKILLFIAVFCWGLNSVYSQKQLNQYQYWFDNDFVNVVTTSISPQDSVHFLSNLNTNGLLSGLHIFHFRCKDNTGLWSSVISQFFIKNASNASSGQKQIVKNEYWFDTDFNNRITQTITGQDSISFIGNLNTDSLIPGLHILHYRCKDNAGLWSSVISQFFFKNASGASSGQKQIIKQEYWFDTDFNKRTTQTLTGQDSINFIGNLNTDSLIPGLHVFHYRCKDNSGLWSSVISQFFVKNLGNYNMLDNKLTTYRYWFDEQQNTFTNTLITPPLDSVFVPQFDLTNVLNGDYILHFQYKDNRNLWSSPTSDSIKVQQIPQAAGAILGLHPVCQPTDSVLYTVQPIFNATSYIWTFPSGIIGTSDSNYIWVNFTDTAISGLITVKGHNEYGDGLASTLNITVYSPDTADVIAGITSVCQGVNNVTYTVPLINNTDYYIWSLPYGINGSSSTNSITVNYSTSAISGNITVKGHNACGDGVASIKAIIVDPLPVTAGTITGSSTVCQGQNSVTYTVPAITHATSYIWTLPTGSSGNSSTNSITVNYSTSAVSGNVTVTGHNNCGDGIISTKSITVNPLPIAAETITGLETVCQGQSGVTYTVPLIINATTYVWTLPTGALGTSSSNSITVNYGTSAVSGNISVKGNNACGNGIISTKAITVNPLPAAATSISGPSTICQGQTNLTYSVHPIAYATNYYWTVPSAGVGIQIYFGMDTSITITPASGILCIRGKNSCGDGSMSCMSITVNPLPSAAGTITGLSTVCQGQNSVTYTVPTITNATSYSWTLPSGGIGTSSTNSITVNYNNSAVSGNITVKGINSCGNGISSSKVITVNPLPVAAGTITGLDTVCQGVSNVTYTIPAIINATSYSWTLPSGISGTSTTNTISVNFSTSANSGNITVKGNNTCGDGVAASKAITVNPLPVTAGTITGLATVCQGQTNVTYSIPAITNATSYSWTFPAGVSGTTSSNSITVNYGNSAMSGNITVQGNNSCGNGIVSNKTITVNPLPDNAGNISGLSIVAPGQNAVIYSVPAIPNATSYIWNLPAGATGISTTNSISVNYSNNASSGNITVKAHNNCGDGNSSSIAITVACIQPVTQATAFTSFGVINTSMKIRWTRGNGDSVLVVARAAGMVNADPLNGNVYTPNASFGNGSEIGSGNFVVYKGVGNFVNITGLSPETTYNYSVYEYYTINTCYKTPALYGSVTTSAVNSTFTAAVSNAWETNANWDHGLPSSTTNALIPTDKLAIVNSNNYKCNNLTISPKGKLTLNTSTDLMVNGTFTIQSDSNGSGSLLSNGTLISPSNNIQCFIAVSNNDEFHQLSSPVSNQAINSSFSPFTESFYAWNETNANWLPFEDPGFYSLNGSNNFSSGRGYAVNYNVTSTKSFSGNINNGTVNIPLTVSTGSYAGWNLIGNPFPSSINWNTSSGFTRNMLENAGSNQTSFWIWNPKTGNYGAYISNTASGTNGVSNLIASSQGFWVKAITAGTFSINNTAREHTSPSWLKSSNTENNTIRLKVTSIENSFSDEMMLSFANPNNLGGAEKMFSIESTAPAIYSTKQNKNWSINLLTSVADHAVIPIGFKAGVNGNYTISVSDVNSFISPTYTYLKDLKTNTLTDLNQNATYTFTAASTDNTNRFQLLFAATPLTISNASIQLCSIYAYENNIYINSNESIQQINIYNSLGQLVKSLGKTNGKAIISMKEYASAYYIVKVVTDKNVYTEKVLVK